MRLIAAMTAHSTSQRAARSRRAAWTLVIAWMAVIFAMSSLPGSAVPATGSGIAHFVMYAVLGGLLYTALSHETRDRVRAVMSAVIIASAYGVSDELHQAFVPGRVPDVVDWGVDTLGALAGALVVHAVHRKRGRGGQADVGPQ